MKPEELQFSKTHEWISISETDGAHIATIGISDFAVQQLTDLVYMELPEVGRVVKAREPLGEIESVKAVSDLYSPVSGEVIEVNEPLKDSLETFSQDPYGAGWVVKVQMTDESELGELMNYADYQKQCAEEG